MDTIEARDQASRKLKGRDTAGKAEASESRGRGSTGEALLNRKAQAIRAENMIPQKKRTGGKKGGSGSDACRVHKIL